MEEDEISPVGILPELPAIPMHRPPPGRVTGEDVDQAVRKFLGDLLMKLSDRQLRDLFETARFAERKTDNVRAATVDEWVGAFKKKRDEIVTRTCPA